jgi:hypothetical protein
MQNKYLNKLYVGPYKYKVFKPNEALDLISKKTQKIFSFLKLTMNYTT